MVSDIPAGEGKIDNLFYSVDPFPISASEEGITLRQCCGSGSTWIRIDLALLDPDPYPYWDASGSRGKEFDQNYQINLIPILLPIYACMYDLRKDWLSGSGSGSGSALRQKFGSGPVMKAMRIINTASLKKPARCVHF
jgi:hypothetical protein